jgi:hypothetical protein
MDYRRSRRSLLEVPAGQGTTFFQQWNRADMADPVELKLAGSCAALISMRFAIDSSKS